MRYTISGRDARGVCALAIADVADALREIDDLCRRNFSDIRVTFQRGIPVSIAELRAIAEACKPDRP